MAVVEEKYANCSEAFKAKLLKYRENVEINPKWEDGNPEGEDRRNYFVELVNEELKIVKPATKKTPPELLYVSVGIPAFTWYSRIIEYRQDLIVLLKRGTYQQVPIVDKGESEIGQTYGIHEGKLDIKSKGVVEGQQVFKVLKRVSPNVVEVTICW